VNRILIILPHKKLQETNSYEYVGRVTVVNKVYFSEHELIQTRAKEKMGDNTYWCVEICRSVLIICHLITDIHLWWTEASPFE
jgi:hypothetical protein